MNTPRAKFNCSNLMKISDIHANLFNQLVPSKAIVFILLLYRRRGKFIFITNRLNSPAMVNGSVKIPAGCVFLNGLPVLKLVFTDLDTYIDYS